MPAATLEELLRFRGVDAVLLFPLTVKPDRPFEFKKHWDKALKQAGVENFVFHCLRHDFCSSLAMHGATMAEIADLAGHKYLQSTKRYIHLSVAHKQKVAESVMKNFKQGLKSPTGFLRHVFLHELQLTHFKENSNSD